MYFFDDKSESLSLQMIVKMKNLIIKIKLSETQITNKSLLKKNKKILKFIFNLKNNEKSNTEEIITFDKKKDYKLVKTLKNVLLILLFSEINIEIIFHIQLLIRMNDQHKADLDQNNEQTSYKIYFQRAKNQDERLEDFDMKKITSIFNRVFTVEQ